MGEDRDWLEARFAALEEKIEAAMRRVVDITGPIARDVERLRADINALFDRAREAEADIAILKSDKDTKKNNTGTILAALAVVAALAMGIIGFVV